MTYRPPHKTPEKTSYDLPSNPLDNHGEKNRGKPVSVTYNNGKPKIVDGNKIVTFGDLARIKHVKHATSIPW
jgi:hypothetical protein